MIEGFALATHSLFPSVFPFPAQPSSSAPAQPVCVITFRCALCWFASFQLKLEENGHEVEAGEEGSAQAAATPGVDKSLVRSVAGGTVSDRRTELIEKPTNHKGSNGPQKMYFQLNYEGKYLFTRD